MSGENYKTTSKAENTHRMKKKNSCLRCQNLKGKNAAAKTALEKHFYYYIKLLFLITI